MMRSGRTIERPAGPSSFRPPSKAGPPQRVGDIVSRVLQRAGLAAAVEAASVLHEWPELVGPQIARVTRARRVSDGTLVVAVASSSWMMELNLMKADLMRRVNAGRRDGRIRQIVFVMDDADPGARPDPQPRG